MFTIRNDQFYLVYLTNQAIALVSNIVAVAAPYTIGISLDIYTFVYLAARILIVCSNS
jgi:hypothetical protein